MSSKEHPLFAVTRQLPLKPGVYLYKNQESEVIYVGKANLLRARVSQYFQIDRMNKKTQHLMNDACFIEFFITNNAQEALILENELIKSHHPKYNIVLKDGRSYPYIVISDDEFPRMGLYRGKKKKNQIYFGPYPHAKAARDMVEILQKMFLIRDCSNSAFRHRTRPCMQYQIKKCSAPCVQKVAADEYLQQVKHVKDFLSGKSKALMQDLGQKMQKASDSLDFEKAAQYRDALGYIRVMLEKQSIEGEGSWDLWLLGQDFQQYILLLMKIRDGRVVHIKHEDFDLDHTDIEEIASWIYHTYKVAQPDGQASIWLDQKISSEFDIFDAVASQWPGNYQQVTHEALIENWLKMGRRQIDNMLPFKALAKQDWGEAIEYLCRILGIESQQSLEIECFDVSHFGGEATCASCVVMDQAGLRKDLYRNYHILNADQSDDYGATREVLERRIKKIANKSVIWLIDGGKGQINIAQQVAAEQQCVKGILGIAKGVTRQFQHERYFIADHGGKIKEVILPMKVRQVIALLRDQAHDRALKASQIRKKKKMLKSSLDDIPGVGMVIKKRLKAQFGTVKNMRGASADELTQVPGVGAELAVLIANHLNGC